MGPQNSPKGGTVMHILERRYVEKMPNNYGEEASGFIYVFNDEDEKPIFDENFHIREVNSHLGRWELVLGRDSSVTDDLPLLENQLFEFIKENDWQDFVVVQAAGFGDAVSGEEK
jgi:hypothetical protein